MPALIARHERAIRRFLLRRSGAQVLKRTTLEDLFQETVAVAMSKSPSFVFVDDARFLTWITAIAHRVLLRSLSDQRRRPSPLRIKGVESSGVGVPETELRREGRSPSSIAANREHETALHRAIATLPEHHRQVLILYQLEGRSLDDVAERMRRSKGATCRLLARAMERLRAAMSGG